MAHADYDCCAVCDRKMDYKGSGSDTKGDICPECREKTGIATVQQLIQHIEKMSPEQVKEFIDKYNFSVCIYGNSIDHLVFRKLMGQR